MSYQLIFPTAASLVLCCVVVADAQNSPTEQVRRAEIAFAKSMADRDAAAFASSIADEAVFFGSQSVMRGKTALLPDGCDCSAKP